MKRLSIFSLTALLAGMPVVAAAETVDLQGANSFRSAVELEVGTKDSPVRHEIELSAAADSLDDAVLIKVDIPQGQRLHASFTLDQDAPEGAGLTADLLDGDGNRSDFAVNPTFNDYTLDEGLRSGYLRSEPMGPENRSFGRDTYLRLDPSATADNTDVQATLTLSFIPEVIDGQGLEDIDRPSLRYPVDLADVDEASADDTFTETISAGTTQEHVVTVDWMEAIDATASITRPAEGTLTFGLYNQVDEVMVFVGENQVSAEDESPVTFGQRAPAHYKNVTAANKTRNSGFLAGDLTLTVTYEGPEGAETEYEIFTATRGEGVPPGTQAPSFDAQVAHDHHENLEAVEHEYYPAPGYEQRVNPLIWVAVGLGGLAIVLAIIALRRRG